MTEKKSYDELYPENARLGEVSSFSQEIGQFLDWLEYEKEITFVVVDDRGRYIPKSLDRTKILAEFYEIDLEKIESEKRAMLDSMREQAERKRP